jgi:hypothetical protein
MNERECKNYLLTMNHIVLYTHFGTILIGKKEREKCTEEKRKLMEMQKLILVGGGDRITVRAMGENVM